MKNTTHPGGIEGDDHFPWFEGIYNLFHKIQVVFSFNVGLVADVAELSLRGDVNGGVVSNSSFGSSNCNSIHGVATWLKEASINLEPGNKFLYSRFLKSNLKVFNMSLIF